MTGDDPELDGTDAAHPAWWRGHDNGVRGACEIITAALENEPGAVAYLQGGRYGDVQLNALVSMVMFLRGRAEGMMARIESMQKEIDHLKTLLEGRTV